MWGSKKHLRGSHRRKFTPEGFPSQKAVGRQQALLLAVLFHPQCPRGCHLRARGQGMPCTVRLCPGLCFTKGCSICLLLYSSLPGQQSSGQ